MQEEAPPVEKEPGGQLTGPTTPPLHMKPSGQGVPVAARDPWGVWDPGGVAVEGMHPPSTGSVGPR